MLLHLTRFHGWKISAAIGDQSPWSGARGSLSERDCCRSWGLHPVFPEFNVSKQTIESFFQSFFWLFP